MDKPEFKNPYGDTYRKLVHRDSKILLSIDYNDLELLELIQFYDPRINLGALAKRLDLSRVAVFNKLKRLRKLGILRMGADIWPSKLGLGRLAILTRRDVLEKGSLPQIFWLNRIVPLSDGKNVMIYYYYPLSQGVQYIVQPFLNKLKRHSIKYFKVYDMTYMFGNKVKFTQYFDLSRKRLVFPWREMLEDLEDERTAPILPGPSDKPMQYKPRDMVDLIVLANIERRPLISLKELAQLYGDTSLIYMFRRHFVEHLVKDRVFRGLYGYTFLMQYGEIVNVGLFLKFQDKETMGKFIGATLGKPFIASYYVSIYEEDEPMLFAVAIIPYLEIPNMLSFLRYLYARGWIVGYKVRYVVPWGYKVYTVPYRNYNAFAQMWATEPSELRRLHRSFSKTLQKLGIIRAMRRAI